MKKTIMSASRHARELSTREIPDHCVHTQEGHHAY
jgi:hypothetical protein